MGKGDGPEVLLRGPWRADRSLSGYVLIGRAVRHVRLERFDAGLDELVVAFAELTEQFEDEQLDPVPGEATARWSGPVAMELAGRHSRAWRALDRLERLYSDMAALCVATVPEVGHR